MVQPSDEQLGFVKKLITDSIDLLIKEDSDIFNLEIDIPPTISEDAKLLNLELHETSINHRLAFYLELNIQKTDLKNHKVDIEYNRYYGGKKVVDTIEGKLSVRPDIIIHTRRKREVLPQHYLVIEAKKFQITTHDINKVKGFIKDLKYQYLFGLTISYCLSDKHVLANLFYFNGTDITIEVINRPKSKIPTI